MIFQINTHALFYLPYLTFFTREYLFFCNGAAPKYLCREDDNLTMQKLYNYFLINYFDKDYVEYSRARLTLNILFITALFAFFYAFIAIIIDFQVSKNTMPVLGIIFILFAFILKTKARVEVIAFFYLIFCYFEIMILIHYSGMMYSSVTVWLCFLPVTANLLLDKNASVIWLFVVIASIISLIPLTAPLNELKVEYNREYDMLVSAVVYNGLSAVMLILAWIFQKSKDNYVALLQEKNDLITKINDELKLKNKEVISQNETLQRQKAEISAQRKFIEIKNRELIDVQDELNNIIEKLTVTQVALASREAENRSILEAIYDTKLLVAEINRKGTLVKVSREVLKLFGKSEESIIGTNFMDIVKKVNLSIEGISDMEELWPRLLKGEHFSHIASLEQNGKKSWLRQNFFPIRNESGEVEKIMVISHNISKTIEQQEKIALLNDELKGKITKIKAQNQLLSTQREEIININKALKESNKKVRDINKNLEQRVHERTKYLELQNKQLSEYAYINAHLLRGPLCSILGLVQLLEHECPDEVQELILHMKKATAKLDQVVTKISDAIQKGSHFDRDELLS